MDRDEVTSLLELQRKLLNDAIDRMHRELSTTNKENGKNFSDVEKSLDFAHGEIRDLKSKLPPPPSLAH